MEFNEKSFRSLAERIYSLDERVYKELGSSLGRVFHGNHNKVVTEIYTWMQSRDQGHTLRSELALIGNMARTIPDKEVRHEIMQEYAEILEMVLSIPNNFASGKILDAELAALNTMSLKNRFSEGDQLIICISRTYSSGGSSIGFKLADEFQINYYDIEILRQVMERLEVEEDDAKNAVGFTEKEGEEQAEPWVRQKIKAFSRYHGLSEKEAVFFNQSDLIVNMAKKESFVIMGRCAEVILTNNHIPHISVYVTAPMAQRVKWMMEERGITEKQARKYLKKSDRQHTADYKFFTGRQWGHADNYDLCINSACYGIDGCVELIKGLIKDSAEEEEEK